MAAKYEPCSICEEYIEGVACTKDQCPVAKMKAENERLEKRLEEEKHALFEQKGWFDPARNQNYPCRIGQDMWCIRNFKGVQHPTKGEVSEMYFTAQMKLMIVVKCVGRGEYGKTVFPTKEEAEAALARKREEKV